MSVISNLFGGHAPLKKLQEHMGVVREAAQQLPALFEALHKEDDEGVHAAAKIIFEKESEADAIKHDLRNHLPRSLFMPISRRDLLPVLHNQDSIADKAEDVAGMILQRTWTVPKEMQKDLLSFVREVVGVVDLAHEIIGLLDELLAVGFKGELARNVEQLVTRLNQAESQTDRQERALMKILFTLEDQMSPVSVMLWYHALEWLGDVADHAETAANGIRLVIAK